MVVDELVQLEPEEAFATITSLLVADVDKIKLAALFSDCADAANTRGNRENERMFLLAELVTSGTFPTNANVEEIRSRANNDACVARAAKVIAKNCRIATQGRIGSSRREVAGGIASRCCRVGAGDQGVRIAGRRGTGDHAGRVANRITGTSGSRSIERCARAASPATNAEKEVGRLLVLGVAK